MIEVTTDYIDKVQFIKSVRILEPDDTIGKMGVHRISHRLETDAPAFIKVLKLLGLRRVGYSPECKAGLYTQYPMPYFYTKAVQLALMIYWVSLCWLYDNARMFKEIPPYQPFSWRYFTPYTWFKK